MSIYSLRNTFRRIDIQLLAEYFRDRARCQDLERLFREDQAIATILETWNTQPEEFRRDAEADLRAVHDLANDHGIGCLFSETAFHGRALPEEFQNLEGHHDRAMWALLREPTLFEVASLFRHADVLPRPSWHRRSGLPSVDLDLTKESGDRLAREIGDYYMKQEGRGARCTAERYLRGKVHYIFVYPDDYTERSLAHDERNELKPFPIRRTFEIVFRYDPERGLFELYAKAEKKKKIELEGMFGRVILGRDLPPVDPFEISFHLDHLKHRSTSLKTDANDGFQAARIRRLRLSPAGDYRRKILFEVPTKGRIHDIHELIDSELHESALGGLTVTQATIQLIGGATEARKPDRIEITVTQPDLCNLQSHPPDVQRVGERYLRDWGIDVS